MAGQYSHDDMNKITDSIYLGNAIAAADTETLLGCGITHILTLDADPVPAMKDDKTSFVWKFVACFDMRSADLLAHFEDCFTFIDSSLKTAENKILIHCFAGMSRSATILIAYLMHKDGMCLDEAYATVKQHRHFIKPNAGFRRQLKLFEKMGRVMNKEHPVYRKYKLKALADQVQTGDFDIRDEDLSSADITSSVETYYKCRKCRRALFRTDSLMTHIPGQGETAFDWRRKLAANQAQADCDTTDEVQVHCNKSIFIEPVKWMADCIKQLEGKLHCPKCQNKLGSFIWYGELCPCGAWVAPAFHITSSKVDLVKPLPTATPSTGESNLSHITSLLEAGFTKSCDISSGLVEGVKEEGNASVLGNSSLV